MERRVQRAERRAAPKPARVPSGAKPGHEQSGGLFMPGEELGHWPSAACKVRPMYPSAEGLQ